MSFLNELKLKKSNLRPTVTTITHTDGRQFYQSGNKTIEIYNNKQCCGYVVDTKPDFIPAKILNGLYLGSQDCCDLNILKKHNINYVLSVGIEPPMKHKGIVYKFVQCLDLPETNLVKNDDDDNDNILNKCVNFINYVVYKMGENVLVHCNAGVSRSATIVIGYLVLIHNYNYIDAYNHVKSARNCIRPNDGFIKQLSNLKSYKLQNKNEQLTPTPN